MSEGDKDREIRELRLRLEALEGRPRVAAPTIQVRKGADGKGWAIVAIVGTLVLVGYCFKLDGGGSQASGSDYTPESAWTPPAGYQLHASRRGGSVGLEWVDPTPAECRGSGVSCWAVNVITEQDCPRSLYASITLLGPAGDNMGWTNDAAQGVVAGERTKLVFRTYERDVQSARIAEINCY